jgi:hypothetical protein
MSAEKRYQVFVSSTYEDLKAERQEVIQALLELDCFPAGMELFPAASEDQWTLIKEYIDNCDYYVVVIGGRYGSVDANGVSYTEREYRYAVETGKPVIAFLHKDPGKLASERTEQSDEGREKLAAFCEHVKERMCAFWSSPEDLGSKVSRSLVKLIKSHPAEGWVRANQLSDESARELLKLRKQIDDLTAELSVAGHEAPAGTEALAQGDELVALKIEACFYGSNLRRHTFTYDPKISWNDLFRLLSPYMMGDCAEAKLRQVLAAKLGELAAAQINEDGEPFDHLSSITLDENDLQTVIVQLKSLGLIARSDKARSVKDPRVYWTLTRYGENEMTRLRALVRGTVDPV